MLKARSAKQCNFLTPQTVPDYWRTLRGEGSPDCSCHKVARTSQYVLIWRWNCVKKKKRHSFLVACLFLWVDNILKEIEET